MEKQALDEMISAFSLGCMDKQNFIQFKKHIDAGDDYPSSQLGEFQNIVALIPTVLELDIPDPKLKDNVAKQLKNFQDEIKGKIKAKKERTKYLQNNITDSEKEVTKETPEPKSEIQTPKKKATTEKETVENKTSKTKEQKPTPKLVEQPPQNKETKQKKKETKSELPRDYVFDRSPMIKRPVTPWALIILFVLVIVSAIAGIYFYQKNSDLNEELNQLNKRLNNLKSEVRRQTEFIDQNKAMIEFLNKSDLEVINLDRTENASESVGKLFLSFNEGKAILKVNHLPNLVDDDIYTLWFVGRQETLSVFTFKFIPEVTFYSIPSLPYIDRKEIELIRITDEKDENTPLPTGSTFLFGALNN